MNANEFWSNAIVRDDSPYTEAKSLPLAWTGQARTQSNLRVAIGFVLGAACREWRWGCARIYTEREVDSACWTGDPVGGGKGIKHRWGKKTCMDEEYAEPTALHRAGARDGEWWAPVGESRIFKRIKMRCRTNERPETSGVTLLEGGAAQRPRVCAQSKGDQSSSENSAFLVLLFLLESRLARHASPQSGAQYEKMIRVRKNRARGRWDVRNRQALVPVRFAGGRLRKHIRERAMRWGARKSGWQGTGLPWQWARTGRTRPDDEESQLSREYPALVSSFSEHAPALPSPEATCDPALRVGWIQVHSGWASELSLYRSCNRLLRIPKM
ncbi:hypothetical protein C8R45DRAFT_1083639 [Mycena sanguinolenta]|nr:hypothetical protein C8R45DRAFT_1083639 [Mycena sanguinolenta]